MKELYRVEGTLNKSFMGQITYTICLDKPYSEMDIHLTYDYAELRYSEDNIPPEVLEKTIRQVSEMSSYTISEAEARKYLVYDIDLKTEMHPLATLNDRFIGCIHKQLCDRHMIYTKNHTSPGCIPQEKFEGVLKVTLSVFNIVKDNTRYTLSVSAQ